MSSNATRAPSAAKRRAIPAPNPDAAPVTAATLPCRRMIAKLPRPVVDAVADRVGSAWLAPGKRGALRRPRSASAATSTAPSLPVFEHQRLQRRHVVERNESLLAAVAGFLHAAERQFDAAARAIAVDEHLARANLARDPHRAIAVAGPDAGDEAVVRRVREPYGVRLVLERHRRQDRAEHFVARQRRGRILQRINRRRDEKSLLGHAVGDL